MKYMNEPRSKDMKNEEEKKRNEKYMVVILHKCRRIIDEMEIENY